MSYIEKEKLIKADIDSIENRVRHAFNQGYDLGYKEGKERANAQNPTTKNNLGVDCVARQDVERFIEGFINEYTPEEELEFINLELDGLKHIPSVTSEPRKGHWKLVQRGKCIDVCCSNCEAVRIKDYAYNYTIDQLNKEDLKECFECTDMRYCPNCGAQIESEVEE